MYTLPLFRAILHRGYKNFAAMASTQKILPQTQNFIIKRGDTWDKTWSFTRKDDGSPIDFSTATVIVQVRRTASAATADISLATGSGVTISGAGNNQISVFHDVAIAPGKYVWDLQVTFSSGKKRTYLGGSFEVINDVSRV